MDYSTVNVATTSGYPVALKVKIYVPVTAKVAEVVGLNGKLGLVVSYTAIVSYVFGPRFGINITIDVSLLRQFGLSGVMLKRIGLPTFTVCDSTVGVTLFSTYPLLCLRVFVRAYTVQATFIAHGVPSTNKKENLQRASKLYSSHDLIYSSCFRHNTSTCHNTRFDK